MNSETRGLLFGLLAVVGVGLMVVLTYAVIGPTQPAPAPVVKTEEATSNNGEWAKVKEFGEPVGAPIKAVLTDAPMVPPPTGRTEPAKVIAELEVKEVQMQIADGATYTFWTFGGKVPGKFIRVRQGDTVEFHLRNAPDSKLPHNIDLHAVTGPGGGAEGSFTAPGHESVFTFKALNAGLYVYHCATAPVALHVANGMYGLIFVEPEKPLPPADREYYVMQGDFYTSGTYRTKGEQSFNMDRAVDENPTYVVFNGADGSLVGPNALKAKVGEKVRLYVGNGGPNLTSSFHVIGEIFDRVYTEGGTKVQENVQTTVIPAGGSSIVEFTTQVPGTYALVDHALFRAFNKGAVGQMVVEGEPHHEIYSSKQKDLIWNGQPNPVVSPAVEQGGTPTNTLSNEQPAVNPAEKKEEPAAKVEPGKKLSMNEQLEHGKTVFNTVCAACHRSDGAGMPGMFPPLAKSDFLMKDKTRSVSIVLNGLNGPVEVNGTKFNSMMPPLGGQLSDEQVANVLTYVRNNFGNKGEAVQPHEVAALRGGGAGAGNR